jgi:hypothetical protein
MFLHWQPSRYETTTLFDFDFVENSTATGPAAPSVTIPTVQTGTVAYLFEFAQTYSGIPSSPSHPGWTLITNLGQQAVGDTGCRISAYYKILSSGDSGSVITGIDPTPGDDSSGGNSSIIIVFSKPSQTVTSVTNVNLQTDIIDQQFPTNIPVPDQTLAMSTAVKPSIAFAFSDEGAMYYTGSQTPNLTVETDYRGKLFVFNLRPGETSFDNIISIQSGLWRRALTTFISRIE